MKRNQIASYLASETGKANAQRFIKALSEKRLLCTVKKVSSSGMSRQIFFGEMCFNQTFSHVCQFNWFFKEIGFHYTNNDCISVSGCGMDMIFHSLTVACSILKENGFTLPDNYNSLCCDYSLI